MKIIQHVVLWEMSMLPLNHKDHHIVHTVEYSSEVQCFVQTYDNKLYVVYDADINNMILLNRTLLGYCKYRSQVLYLTR